MIKPSDLMDAWNTKQDRFTHTHTHTHKHTYTIVVQS